MVLQAAVPGGAVEPGETPQQAAVRETSEETGLTIRRLCPHFKVRDVYSMGSDPFSYHIYYFVAEAVDGSLNPADPDGATHLAAWVELERLCELRFSHYTHLRILL